MKRAARWLPMLWRVLFAGAVAGLVALTNTAATAVVTTTTNGIPAGSLHFSWSVVAGAVVFGIAWGDMKRGQLAQAEALKKLAEAKEVQDERVLEFWSDRWPKVESAIEAIPALERRVERIESDFRTLGR